jgi:hypothetical protein
VNSAKDLFGKEGHIEQDDYEQCREAFNEMVSAFSEEHNLSFGEVSVLLLDLGISSREIDYLLSTEKPSVSGLRLELDRLLRDFAEAVRASKKNAETFLQKTKEALEQAQNDEELSAQKDDRNVG